MAQKGKWIIPLNEVPEGMAIHRYIVKKTDLMNKIALFNNYNAPDYIEAYLNVDHDYLLKSIFEASEIYGLHEFSYSGKSKGAACYSSASFTWNPDAIDKISDDPHRATLGSTVFKYGSASLNGEKESSRNTYNDSYSFKERTPFADYKGVKDLFDTFHRTIVRSRISTIHAGNSEATKADFCWHDDELTFINLRMNIPVQTTPNYVVQVLRGTTEDQLDIAEFPMKEKYAYVYDTHKLHRPLCKKLDTVDRINMIVGISPWFDFDKDSQSWISNEFYGEMHPFEIFANGHVSPLIKKL